MAQFRRDLFPIPIWMANSDNVDIRKKSEALAYKFKEQAGVAGLVSESWEKQIRSDDVALHETEGVTSFHTDNLVHNHDWTDVANFIVQMAGTLMSDTYTISGMTIGNMWTTIYPPGAFVPQHVHNNVMVSGVYYVKAEPDCGELVFTDPSWVAKTMNAPDDAAPFPGPGTKVVLPVRSGDMVLFPAWLPHNSRANKSGEDRIIVSFNLLFEGQVGMAR